MSTRYKGESSSSSRNHQYIYGELVPIPNCVCGQRLKLQTSWTNDNPGRRYWECCFENGGQRCGFVRWHDAPMCARSRKIIPGLLRMINRNEEEIAKLKMRLQGSRGGNNGGQCKCKGIRILSVVCILLFVVLCVLIAMIVPSGNKNLMLGSSSGY
ncbi:uncharacterized protein LOC116011730 [Ipomoea triloba]|uniref:uncharacterized protein LOC116011730 n=1 Tax=Ipomoea triloba TaxID=35885 RepID=UPI00125D7CB3|nr:uncharacterized protein LOC116011730 [Ipomoea triloba]